MEPIEQIVSQSSSLEGTRIGSYICSKKLGEGAFACVYLGFHIKNNHEMVAIKAVDKLKCRGANGNKVLQLLDQEAKAMALCNSNHIVKCYKQYSTERYSIFVLEYCNSQSLYEEIQSRQAIPEPEAKRILKQLILAFAEMHRNKIIHRDLKPENIFKHNGIYKVGDFGFCKIFKNLNDTTKTSLGSLVSMAPEVYDGSYGIKADLWSLGTVYYEMLFGYPPYTSHTSRGMLKAISENFLNLNGISKESVEFFRRVFVADPDQRISWTEIYKLPLFRSPSMMFIENHQDDPDLDQAQKIHQNLQEKSSNQEQPVNQQKLPKWTTNIAPSSAFSSSDLQLGQIRQSENTALFKNAQQINNKQQEMLKYKDRLNFQMQRSIFIFNEIHSPLEHLQLNTNRELLEFHFLILARCFYIMSPLNHALNKERNIFNWKYYQDFLRSPNHKSFLRDFKIHYEQISKARQTVHDVLAQQEGKFTTRITDFLKKSIFARSQFNQTKNMLDGIERMDYTPAVHTEFIVTNYIGKVKQALTERFGNGSNIFRSLNRALECYKDIALLDYDEGRGMIGLKQAYDHLKLSYEE